MSEVNATEVKMTVAQKVDALNTEKASIATGLNSMPEGADKLAAQERIATIDRKVRWYNGRNGNKTEKTARPTRVKSAKVAKGEPTPAPTEAPAPVTVDV